ncbi:hypothetical protein RRG08_004460 [Elysia crispata]|uniref:Uncharacterized protein n=1 Tax=Elysia crispata TaxID=231223 RepID=A0AAE1AWF2_9GAST|nr:hypothetical protein RRG08_004460 [Elysia crispata]
MTSSPTSTGCPARCLMDYPTFMGQTRLTNGGVIVNPINYRPDQGDMAVFIGETYVLSVLNRVASPRRLKRSIL